MALAADEPSSEAGDAEAAPAPAGDEGGSWWTPAKLLEELGRLPVAELFPELVARVAEILPRWYERFPRRVWRRMVKIQAGQAHQTPSLLKELNESAPVIAQVLRWIEDLPEETYVVDLGAGFGFLSMYLSELLPRASRLILVDVDFPNRGKAEAGAISTQHIYDCGAWRVPLHTLKVDLKKGRAIQQLAQRVLRAEASGTSSAAPAILCGVHLCNTLSLRAAQLFNENGAVCGLALAPCCFPTKRHLTQKVVYQLGRHRFAAQDVLDPQALPSSTARFAAWTENILEGLEPGEQGRKFLERHDLHRPSRGQYAQDVYIFAERPRGQPCLLPLEATGSNVVVEAEFGHAAARRAPGGARRGAADAEPPVRFCTDFQSAPGDTSLDAAP